MRRPRKEEGGSWMDTYGDMVTLLLCFFVLLYAISAVDQTKWINLVKSLNPNAVETIVDTIDKVDKDNESEPQVIPDDFDSLYQNLLEEIEKRNLQDEIEVKQGAGFTFLTFKKNVIFDANSYVLKDAGKELLDSFCGIIENYSSDIQQIQILGHTAIAVPGQTNVTNDRFLSSNRATAVLVYIQEKNIIEPLKLVSMGYGEYRPIADNNTTEGRAANRRVEILITKNDTEMRSLDEYYQEVYNETEAAPGESTPESVSEGETAAEDAETASSEEQTEPSGEAETDEN